MRHGHFRDRRAFTLIELLVVIAIVAVLIGFQSSAGMLFVSGDDPKACPHLQISPPPVPQAPPPIINVARPGLAFWIAGLHAVVSGRVSVLVVRSITSGSLSDALCRPDATGADLTGRLHHLRPSLN
jgi:prepilin-type N-terminal cleavage/methylation domain-containing protein